jgi:mono/diheme cytochrome c family protein
MSYDMSLDRSTRWKEMMSPEKSGHRLLALAVIAVLGAPAAGAQDLDQGKPAPKLFADGCAACHRSPRGLAKGRFSLTLYMYLQQHYASNSTSAWALTSYLESVDSVTRAPSRTAAKPSDVTTGRSGSALRPPMPVPGR